MDGIFAAFMAKLFIVGFPQNMQEIELVEMFSLHGIVNTVTIVTDQISGRSKGYGFITMNDDVGAERAIRELDGVQLGGRVLHVRFAEEKQQPKTASDLPKQTIGKRFSQQRDNRTETPKPKRPRRPL